MSVKLQMGGVDVNAGGVGLRAGRRYVGCSRWDLVLVVNRLTPLHRAAVRSRPASRLEWHFQGHATDDRDSPGLP